ncbi:peptidoglycan DD-metalloendopeptidase family protein [Actibacterium pelagium]|uniref:Peptidase M23 n=1 Tax=Actibacterium pelagium TaxID=2029103 RepID=A0A917EIT7_9RHOB|nr:peptidoglycan DD-metalloendopeptidase family protein [Actibacterium pelagium]GGE46258.1 peptidase M23 [Actibacterium pelagium]
MTTFNLHRLAVSGLLLATLTACQAPDFDLRNGTSIDTTNAVRNAAPRPEPDARGVISYPTYQVVVARPGDTVATVAARVGLNAQELASYNGLTPETRMRPDEIIALPTRANGSGTIQPDGEISITTLAGNAIERAGGGQSTAGTTQPTADTPVRHKVERGETAFSIARLYGVSVRALADWNGLGPDLQVREGQYLLIPVSAETQNVTTTTTSRPGGTSTVSAPPSSGQPLPTETVTTAAVPASDFSSQRSSSTRFQMPVSGKIIRDYQKRVNDGIDIAAREGDAVRAAESGTVAAITRDTEGVPILVLKHSGNLLTVYANIKDLKVKKGDSVSRGQTIAAVRGGNPSFLHFEVREGFDSVDPTPYVN